MAYATKEIDHEKRKNGEGSYSPYNYMYRYLMDNYEPEQLNNKPSMALESLEHKLSTIGKEYCLKTGVKMDDKTLAQHASSAIVNFIDNNGKRGDTAHNLGKRQENSFDTIKAAMSDLRW